MKIIRRLLVMEGRLLENKKWICFRKKIGMGIDDMNFWKLVIFLKVYCDCY